MEKPSIKKSRPEEARFTAYGLIYKDALPDPPPLPDPALAGAGGTKAAAAQKGMDSRRAKYGRNTVSKTGQDNINAK